MAVGVALAGARDPKVLDDLCLSIVHVSYGMYASSGVLGVSLFACLIGCP